MSSTCPDADVAIDAFPFLRVLKDGSIHRLVGTTVLPAGTCPQTGVVSKDVVISPETGVSVRIYRPDTSATEPPNSKLPIALYFHGGGFFVASSGEPIYHNGLNRLASEAKILVVSVDYRLAPETPLPAAYDDSWHALAWVGSVDGGRADEWLAESADFGRVFLVGDSAGANIAHHLICRAAESGSGLAVSGAGLIHPYFWGSERVGAEVGDVARSEMVDRWWKVVCPSGKGNDDPLINPFSVGAPGLTGLKSCDRIIVLVAGSDILRDRGFLYYEKVFGCSEWSGEIEIVETEGEDHIFHMFSPDSDKARELFKCLARFVHRS